jgi:hypothetical protein
MTRIGRAITEAIVIDQGPDAFLARLSDPFWFQALGCVMGMDWHSSGITTSVMGALKRGVGPISGELGIHICGGRGKHSLKTPMELETVAMATGLDGDALVRASKLSAKVDNGCLQDGFSIYLHNFIVTDQGHWAVVQQGMNQGTKMARRYHWHSPLVTSFVSDPQAAVVGRHQGEIVNLSAARAAPAQSQIVEFLHQHPDVQIRELRHLQMPMRHGVRPMDVDSKRLGAVLALAYERQLASFSETLLIKGLGPRTLQALALVSEVIFGTPTRFKDPARFAFAHGGKDGSPFPVPTKVYDKSINALARAVKQAKIDRSERLDGLKKLSLFARFIEKHHAPCAHVSAVIQKERAEAHKFGGRTVFGWSQPPKKKSRTPRQLDLFPAEKHPKSR